MARALTRALLGPELPGADSPGAAAQAEGLAVLLAGLSFVVGVIHVGAGVDHAREFALYTPVFALFAALQIAWAFAVARGASHRVLVAGAALNAAIAMLWVASRTVGVPIASEPWVPEPVGAADVMATVAECAIVGGTACLLMSARSPLARRTAGRLAPILLVVLFLSVLYGVSGGHSG